MMMIESQSASAEPTTANTQELTQDAVNRVYARSKGCVKRKGVISVSCAGTPGRKRTALDPQVIVSSYFCCS
jgi:hypothetical protein